MKKGVIISARMSSSRLPKKAIKKIFDKWTAIDIVIERAKKIDNADIIVLATSNNLEDDILTEIAQKRGIEVFRGSLKDKIKRWLDCCKFYNIEVFVSFDADDLLGDYLLMKKSLDIISKDNNIDFIKSPDGLVCGAFTYTIRRKTLEVICKMKKKDDTEMVTPYLEWSRIFKGYVLPVEERILFNNQVRLTLDYIEDLNFFRKFFEIARDPTITLKDAMLLLQIYLEIVEINAFRQKDFLENQKRKMNLVWKIVSKK
jgi:spore coat polysaccharide biosynthesis protein SpsF